MTVSRRGKRGTRAGHMVPESRNRRVLRNAGLAAQTRTPKPPVERPVRPVRGANDNIIGERFGKLTIIATAPSYTDANGATIKRGKFRCECGTVATLLLHRVRNGAVKDCGCVEKERLAAARPKVEPRLRHHPEYETETVVVERGYHTEVETVTLNRAPTTFDKWLKDDEQFFMRRHVRVVEHARELWRMAASSVAEIREEEWFFATGGLVIRHEDEAAARAINLLRRARNLVPRWKWDMFENVVRWNEPYGFPGSRLYGDAPKRGEWAKLVVRGVAETISRSLFL